MGIVSENMPWHFQLPLKGSHTQVDEPTLTGSLIASIKALNNKVSRLENQNLRLGKKGETSRTLASLDTKDLYVRGRKVCLEGGINCLMSSKKIKKDFKEFKDDELALKEMAQIKLFHYKFKDKDLYTDKKRMGVLSEELPEKLQVKQKGELSKPDWPTLWGYLISSIKALYKKVQGITKILESNTDRIEKLETKNARFSKRK